MTSRSLAEEVAARLRYFEGHSDTLGLFANGGFLRSAAAAVDRFLGGTSELPAPIPPTARPLT